MIEQMCVAEAIMYSLMSSELFLSTSFFNRRMLIYMLSIFGENRKRESVGTIVIFFVACGLRHASSDNLHTLMLT
jgi:hypothetical protein